eukprot:746708-Hanusia_phi.AAC.1
MQIGKNFYRAAAAPGRSMARDENSESSSSRKTRILHQDFNLRVNHSNHLLNLTSQSLSLTSLAQVWRKAGLPQGQPLNRPSLAPVVGYINKMGNVTRYARGVNLGTVPVR